LSVHETIGRVNIVKSGSDFEEFSDITVDFDSMEVARTRVVITDSFEPNS
jgi:hypothetical protein